MKKLRPITLINILKKIYSKIITNRLTRYIDNNSILRGDNFGFKTGVSTNNAITNLRNIIDHAASQKQPHPLFICLCDVEKAFDSVPLEAIRASLIRINIPTNVCITIISILTERRLNIQTPYGPAEAFNPKNGVPQGDTISPILFRIFYDPLLTKLKDLYIGYPIEKSPTVNISNIAFADDLTLIASTAHELQILLNAVNSFLNLSDMRMGPSKTIIVHNTKQQNLNFKIGNTKITDIRDSKTLFRFLGVFYTLDGTHKATIDHALDTLSKLTQLVKRKHAPGEITTFIINAVIIPNISYKLQCTPLKTAQFRKIDSMLRSLVKYKYGLAQSTPNVTIYDTSYTIGLFNFETILDQIQITNTLIHQKSKDITGQIQRTTVDTLTKNEKLPISFLEAPIKKRKILQSFLQHVSNRLSHHKLRIRHIKLTHSKDILHHLNIEDYQKHSKDIKMRTTKKITTDIANYSRTDQNLISYTQYQEELPTHKMLEREHNLLDQHFPDEPKNTQILPYFQIIAKSLTGHTLSDTNQTNLKLKTETKHHYTYKKIPTFHITSKYQPIRSLAIWTDGSYVPTNSNFHLGCGIVIADPTNNNILQQLTRAISQSDHPSSTRAELGAILFGLQTSPKNIPVTFYTDSQAAIHIIQQLKNGKRKSIRESLKQHNHVLIAAIKHEIQSFTLPPIFIKVKGHDSTADKTKNFNHVADELAAKGTIIPKAFPITLPKPSSEGHIGTQIYHNDQLVEMYPAKHIKLLFRKKIKQKNLEHLQNNIYKTLGYSPKLDMEMIYKIIRKKKSFLSPIGARDIKFRMQILNRRLATGSLLHSYNPTNKKECPFCKTEETLHHIWICQNTSKIEPKIIKLICFDMNKKYSIYNLITNAILNNPAFISSPAAMGIITTKQNKQFTQLFKILNLPDLPNKSNFIVDLIDTFLSHFYQEIWLPRSNHYYENTFFITRLSESLSTSNLNHPQNVRNSTTQSISPRPSPEPPPYQVPPEPVLRN